jgi:hypothetical protein
MERRPTEEAMHHYYEDAWFDPSVIELLEDRVGPSRPPVHDEKSLAVSFRPLWTLAGLLAIQVALLALAVWLG